MGSSSGLLIYKRNVDILERAQQRATTVVKGLEHVSYDEKLRRLGLPRERRLSEELTNVHKYLQGE